MANSSKKVRKLVEQLDLSEENLTAALQTQPTLFMSAAEYRVQCLRRRTGASADLGRIRAEVAIRVRDEAVASGHKITVQQVDAGVESDEEVQEAVLADNEARAEDEFSKLLVEAFRERGNMATAMVRLVGAEAAKESGLVRAELDRLGLGKVREELEDRYAQ